MEFSVILLEVEVHVISNGVSSVVILGPPIVGVEKQSGVVSPLLFIVESEMHPTVRIFGRRDVDFPESIEVEVASIDSFDVSCLVSEGLDAIEFGFSVVSPSSNDDLILFSWIDLELDITGLPKITMI